MGLCAAAEPNAVRRVANSRRDDRQRPASRCVHRLCREGRDDGGLPHPRVPDGASNALLFRVLLTSGATCPVAARYGRRRTTRRTQASRVRSTGSAGHFPHQSRCTSSTTTWTLVKAASSSLIRSTRRLPIASHRASILPPARSCNSDICCFSAAGSSRMSTSAPHWAAGGIRISS